LIKSYSEKQKKKWSRIKRTVCNSWFWFYLQKTCKSSWLQGTPHTNCSKVCF